MRLGRIWNKINNVNEFKNICFHRKHWVNWLLTSLLIHSFIYLFPFFFHARTALRLKLYSGNYFFCFYPFKPKVYRIVELCTPNNRMFSVFDFNGFWRCAKWRHMIESKIIGLTNNNNNNFICTPHWIIYMYKILLQIERVQAAHNNHWGLKRLGSLI